MPARPAQAGWLRESTYWVAVPPARPGPGDRRRIRTQAPADGACRRTDIIKEPRSPVLRRQLDALIREISRLCIALEIDITQPDAARRALHGDEGICGHRDPRAFRELREALAALFEVEVRGIHELGADEVNTVLHEVRAGIMQLRRRGGSSVLDD